MSRIDELRNDINALKRFLLLLWSKKAVYVKYSLVALVLGVVAAFSIPKIYSSTTILALEPRQTGYNAAVMSLAGMAGINLGFLSEDAYSAELYPTIISSKDFVLRLAKMPVTSSDGKVGGSSYAEYLINAPANVWWGHLQEWCAGLFSAAAEPVEADAVALEAVGRIRGNVRCQVNKMLGLVTITSYDAHPEVCKMVTDSVAAHLNAFIQDYRTSKTRADYEALSHISDSAKARYLDAQSRYQEYVAEHARDNSALYKAQRDFLEGEAQLAYAAYNQMAAQAQMAQVKLQEATPVYNVVQTAYVPQQPEQPAKFSIIVMFVLAAFALATVKISYTRLKEKLWSARD